MKANYKALTWKGGRPMTMYAYIFDLERDWDTQSCWGWTLSYGHGQGGDFLLTRKDRFTGQYRLVAHFSKGTNLVDVFQQASAIVLAWELPPGTLAVRLKDKVSYLWAL